MKALINTKQAAETIGVKQATLSKAVYQRRLDEPAKTPAGHYMWSQKNINAAIKLFIKEN